MTEFDIPKEAKPSFYLNQVLPLLLRTRVVLFEGFGNRLGFDPVPFDIQVLFLFRFLIIILFDCFTFIVKETICTSLVFKKHFLIFDYSVYMSCQPSALNQSNVSI